MNRFYKFAEKAIETAGEAGKRKREHAIRLEKMGASSRMAEIERAQAGGTRQTRITQAGELERTKLGETGLMSRASMREAGLMDRARMEGKAGGMTLYQAGTLGQKKKEFKFEQSQAELEFINEGLKTAFDPMRAIGKVPTKDQTISETSILRNQWIRAYHPPDEAEELIAKNPVELRKNKKTGKLRWYNEYGEPVVNAENPKRKLSSTNMGTLPNEESFEDYTPPSFESSSFGRPKLSADAVYAAQKKGDSKYAIQEGMTKISDSVKSLYDTWLKSKKSPHIKYPFNRSMMGR